MQEQQLEMMRDVLYAPKVYLEAAHCIDIHRIKEDTDFAAMGIVD
jgi:hypothetical protein